jgi:NAD-dependent dihydropyrimidine dehydrogenase PreA subunit
MSKTPDAGSLLREHIQLALDLRRLEIIFEPTMCQGVWECYEVCPVDCWKPDYDRGIVIFQNIERCIACNACVLQCPEAAIELKVPGG